MSYDQTAIMNVEGLTSGLQPIKNYIDNKIQNTPSTTSIFTGASALAGGASGMVPAPQAGDESKFLCADGTWKAIQGGGGSYPIASASNAGLMSAEDKQHLDEVFQSSTNFVTQVLNEVGGMCTPNNLKSNPQLFISLLQYNLSSINIRYIDSFADNWCVSLLFCDLSISQDDAWEGYNSTYGTYWYRYALESSACNTPSSLIIGTESSVMTMQFDTFYAYSNSVCSVYQFRTMYPKDHSYSYPGISYIQAIRCTTAAGKLSIIGSQSICPAAPSAATNEAATTVKAVSSFFDPSHIMFISEIYSCFSIDADTNSYYRTQVYYTTIKINPFSGALSRPKGMTNLGYVYDWEDDAPASTTLLSSESTDYGILPETYVYIALTSENSIKVTSSSNRVPGLFRYEQRIRDKNKNITGGGRYMLFHHGLNSAAPIIKQLETLQSGNWNTINPYIPDGYGIYGIKYQAQNNIDFICCKFGTYTSLYNIPIRSYSLDPITGIIYDWTNTQQDYFSPSELAHYAKLQRYDDSQFDWSENYINRYLL